MRDLLRLALPSAAFAVLTNGYRVVDQYWIQGVGMEAQAAIGSSFFVVILMYAAFELVSAGAGPLVARATGGDDPEGRRRAIGAGLAGVFIIALGVMAIGLLLAPKIVWLLGLEGETARQCVIYLRVLSATALPIAAVPLIDTCFVAMGQPRVPMVLHGLALAVNIVLSPALIYGAGLGIAGAALGSTSAYALTGVIGFLILRRLTGLQWSDVRVSPELARVLRVGRPIAAGTAMYTLVYWAMLKTSISPLGPQVNAALGIGFSALEGVSWPLFHGLSIAVAALVGQHLGAGRPDAAKKVVLAALPFCVLLGTTFTLIFYLGARGLTGLFTEDASVHAAAILYAQVIAVSQLGVALESLFEGVLSGAGDTRTVFWLSAPLNLLRVPSAYLLAFPLGLGAAGVWWAVTVTTWIKAGLKGWATFHGRWSELEI